MCKRLVTVKFLILLLVVSVGRVYSAGFAIMQQGTGPMAVLGVAYNFIYGEERQKNNEIMPYLPEQLRANGDYKLRTHSLALSLYYRF
jgi:hypothetical protein